MVKANLTSVRFEPTISGLDLPILYRLSFEASTGFGVSAADDCLLPAPKHVIKFTFPTSRVLAVPILYIYVISTFTATHHLHYPDLLPYWPRSSVGRASEDLINPEV